ncbi:helix-turn-helix domain-containing protein [Sinomicrobium kalidii]|uniref:helix-turn-helix domain-containing protein n=1 Tax=Sinomicrobium kalidii TaxID=2900738 RepID=UPI001E5CB0E7|nr:helix-turn-helix domain-containing protein [Sinomicrobium kalidii]UGU16247.1 helix-turn-helix domain-containing protein [Sinomicrobium kalidii]
MSDRGTYIAYRIAVPPEFEEAFTHFYFAGNASGSSVQKSLLPSYQTILVFNFGGKVLLQSGEQETEVGKCLVLGPVKKAFDYTLSPGAEILVVNFKDDAFYRFFGRAMIDENLMPDPDELTGENCFSGLWKKLDELTDNEQRVRFILEFCSPYLKDRNIVGHRLANFDHDNLDIVKTVASATGQSPRNIQLQHKKRMGYSAREIGRYRRFLKAIEMIQQHTANASAVDWPDIIHECGYYDQSQLIHDFRHYLNLSPTKYLKFQKEICNPVS